MKIGTGLLPEAKPGSTMVLPVNVRRGAGPRKEEKPEDTVMHPLKMANSCGRGWLPNYGSGLPLLKDKIQFPSFVRTNPSTEKMPYVLSQLVIHFGWTWVGILGSYTDYGLHGIQELKKEFSVSGVCVSFLETLSPDSPRAKIQRTVRSITESTAAVIIVYAFAPELISIMEELVAQEITGKVWIASPSLMGSPLFFRQSLWNLLNGTMGPVIHARDIPLFKDFQYRNRPSASSGDIFVRPFWEHVFRCRWANSLTHVNAAHNESIGGVPGCTGEEQLQTLQSSVYDGANLRFSYTAYNAVYVFAHAVHKLLSCDPKRGECSGAQDLQPWKLLHFVKTSHFLNPVGDELYFDDHGDSPHVVSVANWQLAPDGTNRYAYVGVYDDRLPQDQKLIIHDELVGWGAGYSEVRNSDV
ncbi:hypothetical protein NDU88_002819 [Pleurodeles waltl]|uniref:Receptor ligand binding region domain-containing protein n=1 Tax=Pleurodeles waltl TaxID=8319 RepID=A0AAV7SBN4_PLEWA|nr:hypothetical protein NDU88_002819 [Pleurodeles waltl]